MPKFSQNFVLMNKLLNKQIFLTKIYNENPYIITKK